jgi:uncharacterized protein YecE (DUF72 family)
MNGALPLHQAFVFASRSSRAITHDRRLRMANNELAAFVTAAEVLQSHNVLGPSFIQLPRFLSSRSTGPAQLSEQLPDHLPWALEVRHHGWFDHGRQEQWLIEQLTERKIDFVLFDSRPLYSAPPADEIEQDLPGARKPKTPLRHTVTGQHPFLRIVGRNQVQQTLPWLAEWGPVIGGWLQQGLQPFIFTHAPDDRYAPDFAALMHAQISLAFPRLPTLPPWPGKQLPSIRQKSLFD